MENESRYTITLDDDPMVCKFISRTTGIYSLPFTSAEQLVKRSPSYNPVAVFVDVHLDVSSSGLDIIPDLRQTWPFVPIIVVTNDPNSNLIGNALALGANDFIKKPINAEELNGRLHARIQEMNSRRSVDLVSVGDIKFCLSKHYLEKNNKTHYLPKLEGELLTALLENREMLLAKDELKQRIWGKIAVSNNTLDKKISTIRRALSEIGSDLQVISVYGKGLAITFNKER